MARFPPNLEPAVFIRLHLKKLLISFIIFITTGVLYAITAAPEVTFHDSGELITAAYTLGIPHSHKQLIG